MSKQHQTVTQKDVAELAGVSSAVVSYVINNGPRHVSESTKKRVLAAVEKLSYRPNKFAQALGKTATDLAEKQIGIVIGGSSAVIQQPFYAALLSGIFDYVHDIGYHIRFMHFWDELKDPVLFNTQVHPEQISALILLAADLMRIDPNYMNVVEKLEERIEHIVCLDTPVSDFPTVTFDRSAAARIIVEHFIGLGHRYIAFVGNTGRRVEYYRQALLMHDLPVRAEWMQHPGPHNSSKEGYMGTQAILELDELPTAIFAASDDVAIGVLHAIHASGRQIPRDIAVAGVDNSPFSAYLWPPLTTVNVPTMDISRHVLNMIANNQRTSNIRVVVDVNLIIRQSCGAHSP
ncbi:MAG: LacI family DNA-binding transcriptional regulator [Aggregatilineales bacterium]